MIKIGKKNLAMMVVGAAVLLSVLAATPMLSTALAKPAISVSAIDTSDLAANPYKLYQDPMGSGAVGWYPKLVIGPDGFGYAVWVGGVDNLLYNDSTHYYTTYNSSRTYLSTSVTINIKKTLAPITSAGALSTWNATTKTFPGIFMRAFCSFMDAAFDNAGNLIVFFSNNTIINGTGASFKTYSGLLWNSNANTNTSIVSSTQNWKHVLADLDLSQSVSARGASGQILYSGSDRHLLWNNGSAVMYKLNSDATQSLASATFVGECSMALNPAGTLFVVYSKGATVASKEVFQRSKPSSGAFAAESQKSSAGKECIGANVFIDGSGNPHIVWSSQDDTANYYRYIIKYYDGSTIRNVSTDHGGLTFSSPTISTKILAWQPIGAFSDGKLNIFYVDSTEYYLVGGGLGSYPETNIAWQCYNGASFTDNKLSVLSSRDAFNDYILSITSSPDDDLFVTFFSVGGSSKRINFAKVDIVVSQVVVTSSLSLDLPISYNLTFTVSETDIASIQVLWDNKPITVAATATSVAIPSVYITLGPHAYTILVTDEVGNQALNSGTVVFQGIDINALILITILSAAAVVAILLAVYYKKNQAKIMKRKLGLKLQGKAEADTWDEEAPAEEDDSGSSDGNPDLKRDLKKVDM